VSFGFGPAAAARTSVPDPLRASVAAADSAPCTPAADRDPAHFTPVPLSEPYTDLPCISPSKPSQQMLIRNGVRW
jgi:hypothetical protein